MAFIPPVMPLLERRRELEILTAAWENARLGRGSFWFLCAPAGGGKSHLARTVTGMSARVLWGEADPILPPEPYVALRRALPGFEPADTLAHSTERFIQALVDTSASGPLVCVIEDLHFADESTVAVAAALAQAARSQPWLVLATARPGEGSTSLQLALVELAARGSAGRLDLSPLSVRAVTALIAGVRGEAPPEDEVAAITRDSGGNPWLVQALARGEGGVPMVREWLRLRITRVEANVPGVRRALHALAPSGGPVPHRVMVRLFPDDSEGLRRGLTALRDACLLVERADGWTFEHDLLRRAVVDDMLNAEREQAHLLLAEALDAEQAGTAAELAMHYAAARDGRAVPWSLRAAREASQVDAHAECLAQLERALSFPLDPAQRRTVLRAASGAAFHLGRFPETLRLAEDALAIPGGASEEAATLHLRAANAARLHGDERRAGEHLGRAKAVLEDVPPSFSQANLTMALALQAAVAVEPEEFERRAQRALTIAAALSDPLQRLNIEGEAQAYRALVAVRRGDVAGFELLDHLLVTLERFPAAARDGAIATLNVYAEAVLALLLEGAARLAQRLQDELSRHNLGWNSWVRPYRALELVERGDYLAARTELAALADDAAVANGPAVMALATALLEARAGSPERAVAAWDTWPAQTGFLSRHLRDVAGAELEGVGVLAPATISLRQAYDDACRGHFGRGAALLAVGLARSERSSPPPPPWLVAGSPLYVFWDWANAIAAGDTQALPEVADRLEACGLCFEAALARRDAGRLADAYRGFGLLGATNARRQTAEMLRTAGIPIPRTRAPAPHLRGLSETEAQVCRLVTAGGRNDEIAQSLGISVRTVESHLTRIYQKTRLRSRVELVNWWRDQTAGA